MDGMRERGGGERERERGSESRRFWVVAGFTVAAGSSLFVRPQLLWHSRRHIDMNARISSAAPSSSSCSRSSNLVWEDPLPRPRGRDTWMKRILGEVEKFRPTHEPAPRPTVVLDRRPPSRSMSLECMQIDPTLFESIGIGGNAHMNFLAVAMKERRMLKKKQAEETKQMLEEVWRKNEEELRRQEHARIAEERRKLGGKAGPAGFRSQSRSSNGKSRQMPDQIPLELLPSMHPSHQGFRGLHPLFGRAEVKGFLPKQASAYSVSSLSTSSYGGGLSRLHHQPRLHHRSIHDKPPSAFADTESLLKERNATLLPRSALGVTATRGTYTSQKTLQRRRQRYSQILLGDTPAGKALFMPIPGQTPSVSRPITDGQSRPVTMQRTRSGRVGIFDPDTMEQLVPAIQHAEPKDYLTLASDEMLRQRERRGIYLGHQRMRDRTLSEIESHQQEEERSVYESDDADGQHVYATDIGRDEDLDFLTESIFS